MPIQVKCSNEACLKSLAAPDELAGKVVKCPACGTELSVPAARMLGEYQLVRRIGLGGMGAVYEAIQLKLGRRVALKVLDSTLGENKRFLERFMREARTAASIVHPNVIQVFDFGEDDGQHYFAMEFVEGEDVRQRMQREGRLPLGDALGMVEDVAKVLQAAHKASIIHRDIKPENIMLSSDGMVKLADLGLAKNIEEDTTITQSGAGIGTPYYMAPEQAEDAANVDHRADIYALGISLLHMLTGTYPFDGENPWEIVEKHKKRPLPSGADLGQELPAEVEFLIQKMARKTLDQRYQDYDTLLSDLAEVKSGGKPKGFIAAPGQPLKRRRLDSTAAKRRGGLSALTLVAAASLGVIGVATFMLVSEDPPEPAPLRRTTTVGRKSQTRPKVVKKNLTGDIEAYAAINPHQYSEIITQFDALLKTVSSSQRAEVQAKRKAWGELWRAAAEEEFRTRKQISENQLSARSFTEAEELWIGFPANLRHHSVEAMIGSEVKRIEALKDQIVAQLQSEARGWTSLRTESITREQLASLQAFHRKLVRSAQGLNAEQTKIIEDLAANISAKISAREAVLERLKIQEKDFWKRYVRQMRIGSFDAAREFVRETSALDEPVRKRLLSDTDLVAGFKEKAEKNLPRLVGTWVRLRGTRVKVTSVKEDRLYAKQGEVELGMKLDQLPEETRLSLFLSNKPDAAAYERALYYFYKGTEARARKELKAARAAGGDVSIYEELLGFKIPSWMAGQFEIPEETEDRHGNPIRKGVDAESELPFEIRHKQSGIHFVFIPAGSFTMGTESPGAHGLDESTPHRVTLSRPYYIAKYEVTNRNWENMGLERHHRFIGENFPVRGDFYYAYILYCDLLCMNLPAGCIRLSTEAQWEYACRAGTQKRYLTSDDPSALAEISWHKRNSRGRLHPVGQKKPNDWGVYDMLGNAFEFVLDRYQPYTREEVTDPNLFSFRGALIKRGACSRSNLEETGAGTRTRHQVATRGDWLGFRPVLNLPANYFPLPQGISGRFTNLLTAAERSQWLHQGNGNFEIKDGRYAAAEQGSKSLTVFTGKSYSDFILRLEYQLEGSRGNGGVAVRFPRERAGQSITTTEGFEVEIWGNQTGWILRPENRR